MRLNRRIASALLLSSLLLAGCGASSSSSVSAAAETPAPTATPLPIPSQEEQKAIIQANFDLWDMTEEAGDSWSYAITDLDHNGRCEVIASALQGTGLYTVSHFYEITESYDGLALCAYPVTEGDSEPDIGESLVPCYYDVASDTYTYLFSDLLRISPAEHYTGLVALSLKDGSVTTETIASCIENASGETSYHNAAGEEITEEEYLSAAETRFSGQILGDAAIEWVSMRQEVPVEEPTEEIVFTESEEAVFPESTELAITKNPTGETVEAGGTAWFIAHADNADEMTWYVIDPNYGSARTLASAQEEHPGLELEDLGDGTLCVRNIPLSFNGWAVICRFSNGESTLSTEAAYVEVVEPEPTPRPELP